MRDKKFELGFEKEEKPTYKKRILNIINTQSYRINAPEVNPTDPLHNELHGKEAVDSSQEVERCEDTRKDICDAFGVTYDSEHVYLLEDDEAYQQAPHRVQRNVRAFYTMLDLVNNEGFYGEGRTNHNLLLNKLIELAHDYGIEDTTIDNVIDNIDADPPRWLVFKGFVSGDDFSDLSDKAREVLEAPLVDEDGNNIKTPSSWFISGTNISAPELQEG